ncbi:MAG: hypothetical protein ACPGU1_06655 [Myxococcota bacterium]
MVTSSRLSGAVRAACISALAVLCMSCAGTGYDIPGAQALPEPAPILAAQDRDARYARASLPPGLTVELLCARGPMVRSGFARAHMEPATDRIDGIWILRGDPLSNSRKGFAIPVKAPAADAIPLGTGELFELRAVGRAPVFKQRLPERLQICRWRPDSALLGLLKRSEDASKDSPYELRAAVPQSGIRATGEFTVHEVEAKTGWSRLRFVAQNGRIIRIRYAPILGVSLNIPKEQKLILHVLPPDPVASLSGLAVVIQTLGGEVVAVINGGATLPSELLDGLEISPSGRLVYSEVKQLPSLCVTRLEHQSLRIRSSQGVDYVAPGTHKTLKHRKRSYRFVAYDAVVRAIEDPCGQQAHQHLSYVIAEALEPR